MSSALHVQSGILYICTLYSFSYSYNGEPVCRKFCHWSSEHQPFTPNVRKLKKLRIYSANIDYFSMAVWSRKWYIVCPLVLIILGHWSLLLHGMIQSLTILSSLLILNLLMIGVLLKAVWVPGQGCAITQTDSKLLATTFIYSMVFDFIVLVLTGYKLFQPAAGRSRLVVLIFNDGLVYFAIA